jgi:uncharacterized repeat protein (TIGR01451 family)
VSTVAMRFLEVLSVRVSTVSKGNTLRTLTWGVALALPLVLAAAPVRAQVAAGYSEYYIPGDESSMWTIFNTLDGAGANTTMHSVIAVTAWSPNTTVYYDHWENGYNFDPANPSSADETYVLATTGAQHVFESANIPTNPRGTATYYDGGDRIYVAGGAVTVTRASWIEAVGVGNQSAAWEIYPIKPQLTTYIVPFGENLGFADFNRIYVLVQATADNTTFTVDLNGDGVPDPLNQNRNGVLTDPGDTATVTLQRGQTFLLDRLSACTTGTCTVDNGVLNSGIVIQGNQTLQVKFVAGNPGQTYCARGLSAFPRGFWTDDYYAPLDQPSLGFRGNTDYYLHNPHDSAITINWESTSTSGSFSIPAHTTVSFRAQVGAVPVDSGLYLKGSDVFWGVGIGDAGGATYEWGYSLLPSTFLYKEHFLGWAPGAFPVDTTGNPGNQDNDGVFLTVAQDNTRVFVDFNNDGVADLIDADGDGVPESPYVTLNRLQTQFFYDPTNGAGGGDLSQAHFWATGAFTMAYGENGDTATISSPSLDLGYIAIPAIDFISLVLTVDKTASPQVVPTAAGSVATFTIKVNSRKYTVDGVNVTDILPPNWGYVVGTDSTTITRPDKTTITGAAADPAGSGTLSTLTWSSAQLGGNMAQNQEITITFTARTTAVLAVGTLSENRVQAVGTRTVLGSTQTFTATDFEYVASGSLQITKASSVAATTPLYPGDQQTYTVTVTNPAGGVTLDGVSIYDPIPVGETYVPASGFVTCQRARNVRDQFSAISYTNNDGSVSWAGAWSETDAYGTGPGGTGAGAAGGFVRVAGGQLQFRYALSDVADDFSSAAYNLNTGADNWAGNWTETSDDGSASNTGNQHIYISGGRLWFDQATGNTFGIYRDATIATGSSVTISFLPIDEGVDSGEALVAEYSTNGGASFIPLATFDGGTGGWSNNTQTFTIASFPGTAIRLRFRATGSWNNPNDEVTIDNVQIAYNHPSNASGTLVQRTANLAGATGPLLSFNYTSANLEATDVMVVEASTSPAGPFTTLATFNGGTPTLAPPYDLTPYISASTTIRFRVTQNYDQPDETFSIDNVDISYLVSGSFASGSPPGFLDAADGCQLLAGASLTLTFAVTVDDPLPTGLTSVTNTASTTSATIPLQVSASVTNLLANPSVLSASVAGRVWFDGDGDAFQDIGEPGIANVEVTLRDQFGTPIATAVTDATGRFLFSGVEAGTGYYVEVTDFLPTGLTQTAPTGHSDNRTDTFSLAAGQDYAGADLGYQSAPGFATFGDVAWVDADTNGVRDPGEVGLGGVTLQLWLDNNSNGVVDLGTDTLLTSTTTAPDGSYLFTGVTANGALDYVVAATTPSGYAPTTPTTSAFIDSNSGDVILTADFGYRFLTGSFTIRDRIWRDNDGDGVLGVGELGIAGVTVTILNASLQVIGTTTTAADGTFVFSGVVGGGADYTVRISDTAGALRDFVGTTAYAIARERAEPNLNADVNHLAAPSYGFRPTRSLGDTVFRDANGNGVQDAGDGGFSGISVSLYRDTNGNGRIDAGEPLVGAVTTDANGQYLFAGLADGSYLVSVPTAPAGYSFSGPGSDSDPVTAGIQKAAAIVGGNDNWTIDYGYQATTPRTVSGIVWADNNADGVVGSAEERLAGVTLDVVDGGGSVVATVTTEATGAYSVSGLAAGSYTVRVTDTSGVLTGYAPTYEKTEGTSGGFNYQETVDLSSGDVTDVNFGYGRPQLTYASVAFLHAYRQDGSVVVEWRTTLEVGTAGFHVYRLDRATSTWLRLNERLLPGLIVHPQGGTYRFEDRTAPSDTTLTYGLVECDVRGGERGYGPYQVRVSDAAPAAVDGHARPLGREGFDRQPTSISPARLAMGRAAQAARRMADAAALARRDLVLKVTTEQSGLHYVSATQLAAASGLGTSQVERLIGSGNVKLSNRGRLVRWLPDAGATGIYFLASASESSYTADNVYRLSFESSRSMGTVASVASSILASSFPETIHREEDAYPIPLYFQNPRADFWAWDFLYAGYDGLDTKTLTVGAPDVAGSGPARLVVHLLGGNDGGIAGEHHVTVSLNGIPLGAVVWEGIASRDVEFPVSASNVLEGDNTVELKALLGPGVPESIVFLDSVDLGYERRYRAQGDELAFTAPGFASVEVTGFSSSDVALFDVTAPDEPALVTGASVVPAGDGTFTIGFGVGRPDGGRYLAVAWTSANAPTALLAWRRSDLLDPANRAEYVLIAPEALKTAAQTLADYRNSTGIDTKVVTLEDVYDAFAYGFADPSAIRSFLRYASSRWSEPPRYATLVGRGTWDFRDIMGVGDNLLPPLLAGTPSGLVASDVRLGDIEGNDGVPEIAVGRLPVVTQQGLLDYVAKIEAREAVPLDTWQNTVLMAADDPDQAGDFTSDSDAVAAFVPPDHVVDRVYLTSTTPADARQAILDTLDGGAAIFNYIGHGSPDRLADESILTSADVPALSNGDRLTAFVAMTCSVGNFAIPGYPSLGELLLLDKDRGAYAVWAPSGLSQNDLAVRLDKSFFRARFLDGETVLGDIVIRSLGELDVPGSTAERRMYNLLGEPVSRLPGAR